MTRRLRLLVPALSALAAACGHDAAPAATAAVPTLFGGINVSRDGQALGTEPGRCLSITLSNVPLCTPHVPVGEFFLLTADLVSYGGDGQPDGSLPASGDFRATTYAVGRGTPGSWAFTNLDVFGDPNACGSWDCAPIARGAQAYGGYVSISDLAASSSDASALTATLGITGLAFNTPEWTGPAHATLSASAPCALSLTTRAQADALGRAESAGAPPRGD